MQTSPIALTPMKIQEFFKPIIKLAEHLKKISVKTGQEPLITVSHHIIVVEMCKEKITSYILCTQ